MSSRASAIRTNLKRARERLAVGDRDADYYERWTRKVERWEAELKRMNEPVGTPLTKLPPKETTAGERVVAGTMFHLNARSARTVNQTRGPAYVEVAMGGMFYDPSYLFAQRIEQALDPTKPQDPPMMKRRPRPETKEQPALRDGKLTTRRFQGWTPMAVARDGGHQGRLFLLFLVENLPDPVLSEKDKRMLRLAIAANGGLQETMRLREEKQMKRDAIAEAVKAKEELQKLKTEYKEFALTMYTAACPGWATDGDTGRMVVNAVRFREELERQKAEVKKLYEDALKELEAQKAEIEKYRAALVTIDNARHEGKVDPSVALVAATALGKFS